MIRKSALDKARKSCHLHFSGRLRENSVYFSTVEQIIVLEEPSQSEGEPLCKVVVSSLLKDSPEEYTELAHVSTKVDAFDLAEALIRGYCQYYVFRDTELRWECPRRKELDPAPYLKRLNHAFYTGEWIDMV